MSRDKILFITIVFVFALFLGCRSQPLTNGIIRDIGIEDIDRFQYYISAKITLTSTERIREPDVDRRGTASIRERSFREKIIFRKNTMGVLMDSRVDDDGLLVLEICFEENPADSHKRLVFRQGGPGLERNFFIVYSDPARRIVRYGEQNYTLDTNSRERIFLIVRIDKSLIEQEQVRRVRGRRVGL